jgi:hypothetical protein
LIKYKNLNLETYSITVWKNDVVAFSDATRSGNLCGIYLPLCAAWNKQIYGMQGWYKSCLYNVFGTVIISGTIYLNNGSLLLDNGCLLIE